MDAMVLYRQWKIIVVESKVQYLSLFVSWLNQMNVKSIVGASFVSGLFMFGGITDKTML